MVEAHPVELLRQKQVNLELKVAKRSLLFLSPFLLLVGLTLLGLLGIELIDPGLWFLGLFPTLLVGWWFGHRPLAKLRRKHRDELATAVGKLDLAGKRENDE